jgi:sn-glycerol 3-phosphate transport system permease protein
MNPDEREYAQIGWHVLLSLAVALLSLFPIAFAVSNSFKTLGDAYRTVLSIIPENPTLENYLHVFTRMDFPRITFNTLLAASAVTVFKTVTSILAAYAFVSFQWRWKGALYFIMISTIFIPFSVTMIPNYLTISRLGLGDTLMGVILPQLADATGILLIRQSMKTIPKSILEVAGMENSSSLKTLWDIVIPLVKPAVISTGIIFFINSWNEYVWPVLVLKSRERYTLPLALQMYISSEGGTEFTIAMAVSVLTMLVPLALYLIFQRYIISTFTASGIKG